MTIVGWLLPHMIHVTEEVLNLTKDSHPMLIDTGYFTSDSTITPTFRKNA